MLNTLRWYALRENIHGFYSCYRPVGVTVSADGAAAVMTTSLQTMIDVQLTVM